MPACPTVQPTAGPHTEGCCMAPGGAKAACLKPKLRTLIIHGAAHWETLTPAQWGQVTSQAPPTSLQMPDG